VNQSLDQHEQFHEHEKYEKEPLANSKQYSEQ